MMRDDTIQLSVRRSRQAALDDAGVREDPVADAKTLTSLHFTSLYPLTFYSSLPLKLLIGLAHG